MQKTAPKNTKYSRNETVLKISHHANAIAHAKSSLWVKNQNFRKHVKINFTNHLELFCARNRSKNHQIFEKRDHFESRPSYSGHSQCKSSLWVKNWNSKKHVKINFTNHLELFCARNCSKKHQIFEKRDHFESRQSCSGQSQCKSSLWVKN